VPRGEKLLPSAMPEAPFLGMDHVEAHTTRIIGRAKASELKSSAARFYKGDVLYGRLRPYLNKVTTPSFDGLASAEFIVFPDTTLVRSQFLKCRLNSSDFVSFAAHLNEGDRPRVAFDQIGDFPILLPPSAEQSRIIAKIEELFSELDKGIESLSTAREQLKAYRQSVLKHAFEGKLTEEWRKAHRTGVDSKAAILRRVRSEREAAGLEDFIPPANIQDPCEQVADWALVSIDAVCAENLIGLVRANELQNKTGLGVSYIKMDRIDMDGRVSTDPTVFVQASDDELIRYSLRAGDILFNTRNSLELVGKTALVVSDPRVPTVFNNNLMRIRTVPSALPKFINYQLCSLVFRSKMEKVKKATTSVAAVYGKDLWPLPLVLPPKQEQEEIVRLLDEKLSIVDENIAGIESNLAKCTALRQSILKQAFSGQLVSQDPSDEPASVLLERIRAERNKADAKKPRHKTKITGNRKTGKRATA
jgi:type I restriction enzyme S subunit